MDLSIVIPAYNEADRLPATLHAAADYLETQPYTSEVWVVDDGSTDDTRHAAREVAEARSLPIHVLTRDHAGKGSAVRAGMTRAEGRWRFLCDADHSMPFTDLERFLEAGEAGADVVIGSRQIDGAERENERWYRHVMGVVFNRWVRLWAVRGFEDTQCGYKLFRGKVAGPLFEACSIEGFAFDVEVLFAAQRAGLKIVEIPITWVQNEVSRVSPIRDGFEMAWQVVRLRYRAWTGRLPRSFDASSEDV